MAIDAVSTTLGAAPPPRRQRLLEDERWLAFVLLVPTMVLLGMFIASLLMLATWATMPLTFTYRLYALAVVFALLLLADFWRERTLDTLPGYFMLRTMLTAGAIAAIAWRLLV